LHGENLLEGTYEFSDVEDDVVISYDAGYGNAEDVPADIKQAIMMLAGYLYENREGLGEIPQSVKDILNPYKVLKV
jgi:uncharacterized phiE125 gp8 family phage protein